MVTLTRASLNELLVHIEREEIKDKYAEWDPIINMCRNNEVNGKPVPIHTDGVTFLDMTVLREFILNVVHVEYADRVNEVLKPVIEKSPLEIVKLCGKYLTLPLLRKVGPTVSAVTNIYKLDSQYMKIENNIIDHLTREKDLSQGSIKFSDYVEAYKLYVPRNSVNSMMAHSSRILAVATKHIDFIIDMEKIIKTAAQDYSERASKSKNQNFKEISDAFFTIGDLLSTSKQIYEHFGQHPTKFAVISNIMSAIELDYFNRMNNGLIQKDISYSLDDVSRSRANGYNFKLNELYSAFNSCTPIATSQQGK